MNKEHHVFMDWLFLWGLTVKRHFDSFIYSVRHTRRPANIVWKPYIFVYKAHRYIYVHMYKYMYMITGSDFTEKPQA